jgi:hypothetical protein
VRQFRVSGTRSSGESFSGEFKRDGATWKLSSDSSVGIDRDRLETVIGDVGRLARSESIAAIPADQKGALGLDPPRTEVVLRTDAGVMTFRFGAPIAGTGKRRGEWVEQAYFFAANSVVVEDVERAVERCTVKQAPKPPEPKANRPEDAILGRWAMNHEKTTQLFCEDLRRTGGFVDENQVAAVVASMGMELSFSASGTLSGNVRGPGVNHNISGEWSFEDDEFDITVTHTNGMQMPMAEENTGEVIGDTLRVQLQAGARFALTRQR